MIYLVFISILCYMEFPFVKAGEAELEQIMTKMEDDVRELSTTMELYYSERCSLNTLDECADEHYDECKSIFPLQSCMGGDTFLRPDCSVNEMTCGGLYDFTVSSVSLAEDVIKDQDGNPIKNGVKEMLCYSKQAEPYLIDKFNDEKIFWKQYDVDPPHMFFSTENGAHRIYPARQSKECGTYEVTRRPWYVAASSGPKDVILILDTSGSMSLMGRLELMKQAALRVIDTLTVGDHVGIVLFNTDAEFVGQGNLVQASDKNKNRLKTHIGNISPKGSTNFLAAFSKAFDMIESSQYLEYTSNCNLAILFLTDGEMSDGPTVQNVIDHIENRTQELKVSPHIFLYGLGSDAQYGAAAEIPKNIACSTGGMWSHVKDGGELAKSMANYYKLFALGLGENNNEGFVAWVEPYEFATGGVMGTTVSAPVYDRSVSPAVLVGAVGIDFTLGAMDTALGVAAGSRETLEKLVLRSTAVCPKLNLTQCAIQSLRLDAGGDEALCPNECMDFVGIEPEVCASESDYPSNFWQNLGNRGKSFVERTCCAIGETRYTDSCPICLSWTEPNSLESESRQCMLTSSKNDSSKNDSSKNNKGAIIGRILGAVVAGLTIGLLEISAVDLLNR